MFNLFLAEEEYCQWETFNATCGEGEVIVMRTARYGRMKLGKCLTTDYFVGCSADVLSHVDSRLVFSVCNYLVYTFQKYRIHICQFVLEPIVIVLRDVDAN